MILQGIARDLFIPLLIQNMHTSFRKVSSIIFVENTVRVMTKYSQTVLIADLAMTNFFLQDQYVAKLELKIIRAERPYVAMMEHW